MSDRPADDPLLELAVERALDPVRTLLPSEALEELRKTTRFALSTHPQAQELLRRLRARAAIQASGTRSKDASREEEAAKARGRSQ